MDRLITSGGPHFCLQLFSPFFYRTGVSVSVVPFQYGSVKYFRPTPGCLASIDCLSDIKKRLFQFVFPDPCSLFSISCFLSSVSCCWFYVFPISSIFAVIASTTQCIPLLTSSWIWVFLVETTSKTFVTVKSYIYICLFIVWSICRDPQRNH